MTNRRLWSGILLAAAILFAGCATDYERQLKARQHIELGTANIHSGQYTPALRELLEAEKLTPEDPQVHYYLSLVYGAKGLTPEAVQQAKKAVELKPDYSEALNYLGTLYMATAEWDRAIDAFKKAAANPLYETPSQPLYNMGRAYYEKGDYLTAMSKYDEALAREPKSTILPLIEMHRGIANYSAGYYTKAVTHLKKAVDIVPNLVEAHYWLGRSFLALKNRSDAASEFQTVIRLAPDSELARRSQEQLDRR